MDRDELKSYVAKYKPLIDLGIKLELDKRRSEVQEISVELVQIVEVMQKLAVGGKRLRGLLVILGYELTREEKKINKQKIKEVVRAGVAMEIFHLGLLIQDDWMDRDKLRRGVQTLHSRYEDKHLGDTVATLAGDYTFGWTVEILSKLQLPMERVLKAMQIWGKYFGRVGYGQTLDCLKVADQESLMQILALKSGEYSCVLPLQLGAVLGGGSRDLMNSLERYGMELGWVFQLRDDYLSEWGESEKTGKPVGGDRKEGKKSFALVYGKEKLLEEVERHLELGKKVVGKMEVEWKYKVVLEQMLEWMGRRDG